MRELSFPGTYEDERGVELIQWRLGPSEPGGRTGGFEVSTRIRGLGLRGGDFDGLALDDRAADSQGLVMDRYGDLTGCVLTGDVPCILATSSGRTDVTVRFTLDLRGGDQAPGGSSAPSLGLSVDLASTTFHTTLREAYFEDGLLGLEAGLPEPTRLVCCLTCQYSDYSPGGNGLTGMRCHRDAKEQYLAVRSKGDYWDVPVTESVPEFYLCPEYEPRVAGTGYRG